MRGDIIQTGLVAAPPCGTLSSGNRFELGIAAAFKAPVAIPFRPPVAG